MENQEKLGLVASSSIWVAAILNIIPGLGVGYIYQRRWRPYWFTVIASLLWLIVTALIVSSSDPSDPLPSQLDQLSFYGFFIISIVTALEAGLSVNKASKQLKNY